MFVKSTTPISVGMGQSVPRTGIGTFGTASVMELCYILLLSNNHISILVDLINVLI